MVQDSSFLFKLYSYLILFMDGTINGLDTMSSFGESHSSLVISWILHDNYMYVIDPCLSIYLCCRYMALLVVSLVCYVITFSFSGLLFYLFTPSGQDCGLNTFFIVMTLIFVFVFAVVTLHPAVSILSSSNFSKLLFYTTLGQWFILHNYPLYIALELSWHLLSNQME